MTRIAAHSVRKIETFRADTGEDLVFHQPGSLKIARRPEHAAQLEEEVARGRRIGLDVAMISLEQARGLMPYLHTEGVLAVMHMRTDVYIEPAQIPALYASASSKLGATVLPNTLVEEVKLDAPVGETRPGSPSTDEPLGRRRRATRNGCVSRRPSAGSSR